VHRPVPLATARQPVESRPQLRFWRSTPLPLYVTSAVCIIRASSVTNKVAFGHTCGLALTSESDVFFFGQFHTSLQACPTPTLLPKLVGKNITQVLHPCSVEIKGSLRCICSWRLAHSTSWHGLALSRPCPGRACPLLQRAKLPFYKRSLMCLSSRTSTHQMLKFKSDVPFRCSRSSSARFRYTHSMQSSL
jgi:hypothetical protein